MKKVGFLVILLTLISNVTKSQITQIKDFANTEVVGSSNPKEFVVLNGIVIFVAFDPIHGSELWRTDGTEAGTYILKDIYPGSNTSTPQYLKVCNNKIYFKANDGSHNNELWISDGTVAGTYMLKDINIGLGESYPGNFCCIDSSMLFSAYTPEFGTEIWVSDGTPGGTELLKDIWTGQGSGYPGAMTNVNNMIYFSANDSLHGEELWVSDGSSEGTFILKDIAYGKKDSDPNNFVNLNNELYFVAFDTIHGFELWKSDGTTNGTNILIDINPGYDGTSNDDIPSNLMVFNGKIYFQSAYQTYGKELFISDGTAGGTYLLKDLAPGYYGSRPGQFKSAGSLLYFTADDTLSGRELWVSNGTSAGTYKVRDIYPGKSSSYPTGFTAIGNQILFQANDSLHGYELWISNGTFAGTTMLKDIRTGIGDSSPDFYGMIALNNEILFGANDGTLVGRELWKSDGTANGTVLVKDICKGTASSEPANIISVNGKIFFSAVVDTLGQELCISDGTSAGTIILKDIRQGSSSSGLNSFLAFNNSLIFTANNGINGSEPWISDGTIGGTYMLKDINPSSGSYATNYAVINNTVVFDANDGVFGNELWKTDGTNIGTSLLKDVTNGGAGSSFSAKFINNGFAYFNVWSNSIGYEPWVSNGTASGTSLFKDIIPGNQSGNPSNYCQFGADHLFSAYDSLLGNELWISNGSSGGTFMIKDICTGSVGSNPSNIFKVGNHALFTAFEPSSGIELWKTDGTESGTVLLADITQGTANSVFSSMIVFNNKLYFSLYYQGLGNELWISDGTTDGTHLLIDIYPGSSSSNPSDFVVINNHLYFYANNGVNGIEVWTSDGTVEGTFMAGESLPGPDNIVYRKMVAHEDYGVFCGRNDTCGYELWRFNPLFVSVKNISQDTICAGSEVEIEYEAIGSFLAGNNFTFQLSDSLGNFINPTILHVLHSDTSGILQIQIPDNISSGNDYRIRIIASEPNTIIGATSVRLKIIALTHIILSPIEDVCINVPEFDLSNASPAGGEFSGISVNNNRFNPNIAGSGLHTISYSFNTEGCIVTDTFTIFVKPLPTSPIQIVGLSEVCQGNINISYTSSIIENTLGYIWSLPNGSIDTTLNNEMILNFNTSDESGSISIKGYNNCGLGEEYSVFITVNPLPLMAGDIIGDTIVCQEQNSVIYSVQEIIYADSYSWTLPSGVTGSSDSSSIIVTYGENSASGNIVVKGINDCGEGVLNSLFVNVNLLLHEAGEIIGENTVCQGETSLTYTTPAVIGATSYQWTLPIGFSGFSNTNSIIIEVSDTATSNEINVKALNSCGESSVSSLFVNVNQTPQTPTITQLGSILQSSATQGNQWYNQNDLIVGAINQTYQVIEDGLYYVVVSELSCSSEPSNSINVLISAIDYHSSIQNADLKLFPNPTSDFITFLIPENEEIRSIKIYDTQGQLVQGFNFPKMNQISVENYQSGLYYIDIVTKTNKYIGKFVKQKHIKNDVE